VLGLAIQTVHTSGINLASIVTIVTAFAAVTGILITLMTRRADRREKQHDKEMAELRQDFTEGLSNLGKILSARLETKDVVSAMNARLARLEGTLTHRP
jgi:hypothetical protein